MKKSMIANSRSKKIEEVSGCAVVMSEERESSKMKD